MSYKELLHSTKAKILDKGISTKILDGMSKLRVADNKMISRRWIWELIQNAVDVVGGEYPCDIEIKLTETELSFSHNGRPFTINQVLSLINQVSGKERYEVGEKKKTTGKFGTGFMTTHLLSEVVQVTSLADENNLGCKKLSFALDRSGKTLEAINESVNQSMKSLEVIDNGEVIDYTVGDITTTFSYILMNEDSYELAKTGVRDLGNCLDYEFIFLENLNSVKINDHGTETTFIFHEKQTKTEDICMTTIDIQENQEIKKHHYIHVEMNDTIVAFPFDMQAYCLLPIHQNTPRLYCNFPLIGSENFIFPAVVQSDTFEPNEPRSGVYLVDENNEMVQYNRNIIQTAFDCYEKIVEYVSAEQMDHTYELLNIPNELEYEWVTKSILEEYQKQTLHIFAKYPLIRYCANPNNIYTLSESLEDLFLPNYRYEFFDEYVALEEKRGIYHIFEKKDIKRWCQIVYKYYRTTKLNSFTDSLQTNENKETIYDYLQAYYDLLKLDKTEYSRILTNNLPIFYCEDGVYRSNDGTIKIADLSLNRKFFDTTMNLYNQLTHANKVITYFLDAKLNYNFFGFLEIQNRTLIAYYSECVERVDDIHNMCALAQFVSTEKYKDEVLNHYEYFMNFLEKYTPYKIEKMIDLDCLLQTTILVVKLIKALRNDFHYHMYDCHTLEDVINNVNKNGYSLTIETYPTFINTLYQIYVQQDISRSGTFKPFCYSKSGDMLYSYQRKESKKSCDSWGGYIKNKIENTAYQYQNTHSVVKKNLYSSSYMLFHDLIKDDNIRKILESIESIHNFSLSKDLEIGVSYIDCESFSDVQCAEVIAGYIKPFIENPNATREDKDQQLLVEVYEYCIACDDETVLTVLGLYSDQLHLILDKKYLRNSVLKARKAENLAKELGYSSSNELTEAVANGDVAMVNKEEKEILDLINESGFNTEDLKNGNVGFVNKDLAKKIKELQQKGIDVIKLLEGDTMPTGEQTLGFDYLYNMNPSKYIDDFGGVYETEDHMRAFGLKGEKFALLKLFESIQSNTELTILKQTEDLIQYTNLEDGFTYQLYRIDIQYEGYNKPPYDIVLTRGDGVILKTYEVKSTNIHDGKGVWMKLSNNQIYNMLKSTREDVMYLVISLVNIGNIIPLRVEQ